MQAPTSKGHQLGSKHGVQWQRCLLAKTGIIYVYENGLTNKLTKYSKLGPNGQNLDTKCAFLALELYVCSFQAPHCLTQTYTNGNTLSLLIQFFAL